MKKFWKKNWFIICILIFTIIRLVLTASIPITGFPSQVYDDDLMVKMAESIRSGNWLGEYDSNTLVKGPFFPFLLALINYIGLSYINVMNIIYIMACAYFIYTIKNLFKSKISLLIIYILLIFNPVSYASWTLQRVYRNGITLAQVLFIIGSMYTLYERRNQKSIKGLIVFPIIAGLALSSLWLTREDGIWILPFVLMVIIITIVSLIVKNRIDNIKKIRINKNLVLKLITAVLPMILLIVSLNIVRLVNKNYYGVSVYNEISDGYFGKVIKIMYSVKTDENIEYVTVTRKKLNMLYEQSETLNSIKNELEKSMNAWDGADRKPGDGQVEDGWFWWALKSAVEEKGMYENAEMANEFYKKIYEEIDTAIKEGNLETQISMPSNLMSPWKSEYFIKLPVEMAKTSWYIANFNEVETVNRISEDNSRLYEALTNDNAIYSADVNQNPDVMPKYTQKYVDRLNNIGKIYKMCGVIFTVISLIIYIVFTVNVIRKKYRKELINMWLLLTGIGCSLLVLIAGVSYNQITACFSRYYMYLSGAYPLLIAFWGIAVCGIIEFLKNNVLKRNDNINIQK